MDPNRVCPRLAMWGAALTALACGLTGISVASAATPARVGYARLVNACPPPRPASASCFAVVRRPISAKASAGSALHEYTVGAGAASAGPAGGLTPADLESAYGYDPSGGTGQTVAVVDAYDDPDIEEDLAVFDAHYGLGECTEADGCFRKVNQRGKAAPLPEADTTGWSQEISLDVETVRAVCRGCKILLVEAESADYANLASAVDEAAALGATEVSNSYGSPEQDLGSEEAAAYDHPGVVITAASGDDGYDDWNYGLERKAPPAMPNAPASLPSVVSVGGTSLHLRSDGTRANETVWNDDGFYDENEIGPGYVTGSGCSTRFTAQPWQQDVSGFSAAGCAGKRLAVDVSADADPLTGLDVYDNFDFCEPGSECEEEFVEAEERYGGWETFGGTSLPTPMIASLYALAGGGDGLSDPALTLYGHLGEASALYDVTEGGDGLCDGEPAFECGRPNLEYGYVYDCEETTACDAGPGYDGPSGVGAPNGLSLFKLLLPVAAITPPGSPKSGFAATFSGTSSSDPYPGGSISSYSWSWGDGTPNSSGAAPSHTYAAPGEYTVTLTVSDDFGLTSAPATHVVNVGEGPAEEAARRHAEEETAEKAREAQAAQKMHEEEAAAAASTKKRHEEEAAKGGVLGVAEGSPDATIASASVTVSPAGTVVIKIECPVGESSCIGKITLRTLHAVVAAVSGQAASQKAAVLTLAAGSFTVAGGHSKAVTLHLSAAARRLLTRMHVLSARATIVAHDLAGATHTGHAIVLLRAPSGKRRKG